MAIVIRRPSIVGYWLLVFGYWMSFVGRQWSGVGSWIWMAIVLRRPLIVGYWLLVFGFWMSFVGRQSSGVGSWIWMAIVLRRPSIVGCRLLDVLCRASIVLLCVRSVGVRAWRAKRGLYPSRRRVGEPWRGRTRFPPKQLPDGAASSSDKAQAVRTSSGSSIFTAPSKTSRAAEGEVLSRSASTTSGWRNAREMSARSCRWRSGG